MYKSVVYMSGCISYMSRSIAYLILYIVCELVNIAKIIVRVHGFVCETG